MPDVRRRVIGWLDSHYAADAFADGAAPPTIAVLLDPAERGRAYARWWSDGLAAADLLHVAADLTALAEAAGRTLPAHRIHDEMLPCRVGLLCWAQPVTGSDGRAVIGASWVRVPEGVWVELWVDPIDAAARVGADTGDPGVVERVRREFGRLGPDEGVLLPMDVEWQPTGAAWDFARGHALTTLIATWLLMGQTLSVSEQVRPAPVEQRRAVRRGEVASDVTYVALRRQTVVRDPREPAHEGRDYRHQWVVRGHWRNQWYRSVETHRPIWIDPHIKGPEGAPMLHTEHVYTLRR